MFPYRGEVYNPSLLCHLLRKLLELVILFPMVCAVATSVYAFSVPNQYTATTSMYVVSKSSTDGSAITRGDLSASQMLTNDVASIIKSDRVKEDVASQLGLNGLGGYKIDVSSFHYYSHD